MFGALPRIDGRPLFFAWKDFPHDVANIADPAVVSFRLPRRFAVGIRCRSRLASPAWLWFVRQPSPSPRLAPWFARFIGRFSRRFLRRCDGWFCRRSAGRGPCGEGPCPGAQDGLARRRRRADRVVPRSRRTRLDRGPVDGKHRSGAELRYQSAGRGPGVGRLRGARRRDRKWRGASGREEVDPDGWQGCRCHDRSRFAVACRRGDRFASVASGAHDSTNAPWRPRVAREHFVCASVVPGSVRAGSAGRRRC